MYYLEFEKTVNRLLSEDATEDSLHLQTGDCEMKQSTVIGYACMMLLSALFLSSCAKNDIIGAAYNNDLARVKEFVAEDKQNIHAMDDSQRTPLMYAASYGHTEIVKYLVKQGARVDAQDFLGYTSLMYAVEHPSVENVKYLLEVGADPNIRTNDGETALIIAAGLDELEKVKLLIKHGAKPHYANKKGYNALEWAKKWKCQKVYDYLGQSG